MGELAWEIKTWWMMVGKTRSWVKTTEQYDVPVLKNTVTEIRSQRYRKRMKRWWDRQGRAFLGLEPFLFIITAIIKGKTLKNHWKWGPKGRTRQGQNICKPSRLFSVVRPDPTFLKAGSLFRNHNKLVLPPLTPWWVRGTKTGSDSMGGGRKGLPLGWTGSITGSALDFLPSQNKLQTHSHTQERYLPERERERWREMDEKARRKSIHFSNQMYSNRPMKPATDS